MEPTTEIIIKGVQEDVATELGEAVADVVRELRHQLDFRRLRRILITNDFAGELKELTPQTASKNPITHTNEEYGSAVAKVLLLPFEDDYEIVPVISAETVAPLLLPDEESHQEAIYATLHYPHHEFCHVHDDNKKIDALYDVMLHHVYCRKEMFIRPVTEVVWSEYLANRISSSSATVQVVSEMAVSFKDAILRTKPRIDGEIRSYRYHADLEKLMELFQRHGDFLVKAAADTLGYVDGLDKTLLEISPEAAHQLSGSYFERTWGGMHDALRKMHEIYPDGWASLEVYDDLAKVIENYYSDMGLILSTTKDGGAYVDIPFRPETTVP